MDNLSKIKAAWAMGWAAQLENGGNKYKVILYINSAATLWNEFEHYSQELCKEQLEELTITGYLYAGQLAGNEPIPEGQRFIDKKTGVELKLIEKLPPIPSGIPSRFFLRMSDGKTDETHVYFKEEIEPYFE